MELFGAVFSLRLISGWCLSPQWNSEETSSYGLRTEVRVKLKGHLTLGASRYIVLVVREGEESPDQVREKTPLSGTGAGRGMA